MIKYIKLQIKQNFQSIFFYANQYIWCTNKLQLLPTRVPAKLKKNKKNHSSIEPLNKNIYKGQWVSKDNISLTKTVSTRSAMPTSEAKGRVNVRDYFIPKVMKNTREADV